MIEDRLANIHARAMVIPKGWRADELRDVLNGPGVFLVLPDERAPSSESKIDGFALGRVVLDEAELLTLAVAPDAQGRGLGRKTLAAFEARAALKGAASAFLEVAVANQPARRLYMTTGWAEVGHRRGYYSVNGERHDALAMRKSLTGA